MKVIDYIFVIAFMVSAILVIFNVIHPSLQVTTFIALLAYARILFHEAESKYK